MGSPTLDKMKHESGAALPQSHIDYAAVDGELFASYLEWRDACLFDGAVTRQQKLLMVVAMMVAQKSAGPLRVYASIALEAGASVAQIKEALRVGVLFSGGAGIDAAASIADLLVE